MTWKPPTKGDPLSDRLEHAFGRDAIKRTLDRMMSNYAGDPLRHLTDDAIDELKLRLFSDLKFARKIRSHNRRISAEGKIDAIR